jgi:hypothetical protein
MAADSFHCPNCNALYRVVKVEAGPETPDAEITCRNCGGSLTSREGNLVLKYFLVRKPKKSKIAILSHQIGEARRIIDAQQALLEKLRVAGAPTHEAEGALLTYASSLMRLFTNRN